MFLFVSAEERRFISSQPAIGSRHVLSRTKLEGTGISPGEKERKKKGKRKGWDFFIYAVDTMDEEKEKGRAYILFVYNTILAQVRSVVRNETRKKPLLKSEKGNKKEPRKKRALYKLLFRIHVYSQVRDKI